MPVTRYIYALNDPSDPDDALPRYIGQTLKPKARLSGHAVEIKWASTQAPVKRWAQALKDNGLTPRITILGTVQADDSERCRILAMGAEWNLIRYIAKQAPDGWLLNCIHNHHLRTVAEIIHDHYEKKRQRREAEARKSAELLAARKARRLAEKTAKASAVQAC